VETFFITVTVLLVVIISLPLFRVFRGPTVFDRLLAISTMGSKTIGLICLFGISFARLDMFVDIALAYAILNFIGGIAVARYFDLKDSRYE
jgi:multicomponent Na+:H+ antiporter subunit F